MIIQYLITHSIESINEIVAIETCSAKKLLPVHRNLIYIPWQYDNQLKFHRNMPFGRSCSSFICGTAIYFTGMFEKNCGAGIFAQKRLIYSGMANFLLPKLLRRKLILTAIGVHSFSGTHEEQLQFHRKHLPAEQLFCGAGLDGCF